MAQLPPSPEAQPALKPSRKIGRVLRGALWLFGGPTLLAATYVVGPALWRAQDMAQSIDSPYVRDFAALAGVSAEDAKESTVASALAVQAVVELSALAQGYSVHVQAGKGWYVHHELLNAMTEPASGTLVLFNTQCYEGEQWTEAVVSLAREGHTSAEVSVLVKTDGNFKPEMASVKKEGWFIREERQPGESPRVRYVGSTKPKPLWHIPRLGSFEETATNREAVAKIFPFLDGMNCSGYPENEARPPVAEHLAGVTGLSVSSAELVALKRWLYSDVTADAASLPKEVTLVLPTGPRTFEVNVAPQGCKSRCLELSVKLSPTDTRESVSRLFDALPVGAPPYHVIHSHEDVDKWLQMRRFSLRDGKMDLFATAKIGEGKTKLGLRWEMGAVLPSPTH